ncbi:MAG: coproporphyrinogen-III oxidase family protein [Bacteriovoracaceae bacterium]
MPSAVSSLYLHVPFCKHLCNYCDFYKRKFDRPDSQIEEFHQFLSESWQRHGKLMTEYEMVFSPLQSVYLGGGTPSLWGKSGAEYFEKNILSQLSLASNCEFTMEVDPGTWTPEMLQAWQKLGLNRISIGTQTLDPNFLKIMDRAHSLEESYSLLTYCSENDINFSLDFLLGIPFSKENKRNIKKELDDLLKFRPKHISLYILNARSKYPHIQNMPDDEFIREEYLFVSEHLKSHGFHHYEVSNFSLPSFEAYHNVKYWQSASVAALGPSGTGYFNLGDDSALRYKWKVSKAEVEIEKLSAKELNLEKIYLSLRLSSGWKPMVMREELTHLIKSWESLGYAHFTDETIKLNSLGFLMLDSLMDDLFKIGY